MNRKREIYRCGKTRKKRNTNNKEKERKSNRKVYTIIEYKFPVISFTEEILRCLIPICIVPIPGVHSEQQTFRPFCCCVTSVWVDGMPGEQQQQKKKNLDIPKLNEKINTYTNTHTHIPCVLQSGMENLPTAVCTAHITLYGLQSKSLYRHIDIYYFSLKIKLSIMVWLFHSSFRCCRYRCWNFFSVALCVQTLACFVWHQFIVDGSHASNVWKTRHTTFYIENQKNGWAQKSNAKKAPGDECTLCDRARERSLVNEHSTHEVLIVFASSPLLILFVSTNALKRVQGTHEPNGTAATTTTKQREYGREWYSVANTGDTTPERS